MFPVITKARPRRTVAEQFEEDLTCPLCFELFVDPHIPKDLDCPHVVCQMCLKDMVKGMKRTINCPECRRKTRVPQGGIRSLKTDLRLRSLAKKHHDHQTVKQKTGAKVCPRHGEELRLVCLTCKTLICPFCLIDEHRRGEHVVKGLGEVRQEQKAEMVHIMQDAESEREKCNKRAGELLEIEKQIESALKIEEDKIDKRVEVLIQEARQKGQDMKVELRKRDQKRLDRIRQERLRMSEQAMSIKTACLNSLNISDTVPDAVYVKQHDTLIRETRKLMTFDELSDIDTSITVTMFVPDTCKSSVRLGKVERVAKTRPDTACV